MTEKELQVQISQRANDAKEAGGEVDIQENISFVSVVTPIGEEYSFQGEEAEHLLADVPTCFSHMKEEYLLAISQEW